jgi:gas vesicle protein
MNDNEFITMIRSADFIAGACFGVAVGIIAAVLIGGAL